ncbi:TriE protein, partial [Salmonella enterica subsp. enterica serovar Virchow]|nr:TriE protein [Salmonella enterica subsp. enterica serovar Virchow]
MAQGFFVKYNSTVMDSVDKISSSYQTQFANDIMSLATVSVTLYVLWKGYQILASKT